MSTAKTLPPPAAGLSDAAHVAASAVRALAGAAHHHRLDRWIRGPGLEPGIEGFDERQAEGVERAAPVEQHDADPATTLEQDLPDFAH